MKKNTYVVLVILALFVFSGLALGKHHEIKVSETKGLGKYITDTEGKTLYWFKKDTPGTSACSGSCLDRWPIYFRDKLAPPQGMSAADFGTITRGDGKKQTTYKGYPLYYWTGDAKAGDTKGQGVGNVWYVIDPDNFPPK